MRISTIIPAYNRADLIGETLRTVLEQTRPPHEVIVVDDGSTDGTPDVVAGFGKAVTLLRQANAGAGPARNAGFARSSGEIISFMDSDDLLALDHYAVSAAAIEAGADMTYGPWLRGRFDGHVFHAERLVFQQRPVPDRVPLDVLALMTHWVTVFQPCLFHRPLIQRAGPYRSDLKPSEDSELLYRVLATADAPTHVPEALVLYRVHPENQISERDLPKRLVDRLRLWTVLQEHMRTRTDIAPRHVRTFRRAKFDVVHEARAYAPKLGDALAADVPAIDRWLRPVRRFARRVRGKLRRMIAHDPYYWSMGAGPLRDDQRAKILALGYELREEHRDR